MKKTRVILWVTMITFSGPSFGRQLTLSDLDCKLMGASGETEVKVYEGDKSIGACVISGVEASCTYIGKNGKPQGQPTKYEVIDLDDFQIWNSPSGSIKVLLDFTVNRYYYGMTYISLERGNLLNKQCVGNIKE